jgi:hypothetical protein
MQSSGEKKKESEGMRERERNFGVHTIAIRP